MKVHLAVDLGAGSGRVLAGKVREGKVELEELHRFENPGTSLPSGLHWNILGLYREILKGIATGVERYGKIESLGIDTWGVDYGLLDKDGRLLGLPQQYRDPRTQGFEARADELVGNDALYDATGIMPFFLNTSVQLLAEKELTPDALNVASQILLIPDLLAYWLTGELAVERTNASTTQLFSPITNDWAWEMIEGLSLPKNIFGRVVESGTLLGNLRPEVAEEVGATIPVIATATHDTAAAVAGIPGEECYAFLSSGTWTIIGCELMEPIITARSRELGFANELGVEKTVRFLKNISGLWLIQECKRSWASHGEDIDYAGLAELASVAEPFIAFVDPDAEEFASPGKMPEKIQAFCDRTGQKVPSTKGEILRVATESIALKHRLRFQQLRELTGKDLKRVHMGGGGIKNSLLTQAIADACGVPVYAGPVEATACGNLITQMVATGDLASIAEGRELIRNSLPLEVYEPKEAGKWDEVAKHFEAILVLEK
ncbi:rhamnulokinase family protein [Roseibacillus persicicus]|uniref:rhamnulokinase n=1 Tax=Roseibacillus persicicus TaxID=454148 RepID=UPI00398A61A3